MNVRGGFRGDSEEMEERASGRRMHVGPGESGMMNQDGGTRQERVGLDDSNELSCPVYVRDLKLRVSKARV